MKNIVDRRPDLSVRYSKDNVQSWSFQVKIDNGNPLAQSGERDREIGADSALPRSTLERLNRKYLR